MLDEIKQNGKTVLSGEDGFSIPMFFNNLCGKWKIHSYLPPSVHFKVIPQIHSKVTP